MRVDLSCGDVVVRWIREERLLRDGGEFAKQSAKSQASSPHLNSHRDPRLMLLLTPAIAP